VNSKIRVRDFKNVDHFSAPVIGHMTRRMAVTIPGNGNVIRLSHT